MTTIVPRRELATRRKAWAARFAASLARTGVRPDVVSMAGIVFALLAMGAFGFSASSAPEVRALLLLSAAAAIQLRLLCNLLDGMLAVEHGLASARGPLFNEVPDRLADIAILVGAGHAVPELPGAATLGWMAAMAALFTAYARVLAGSLGLPQDFGGPMAKQHRMFVLTVGAIVAAIEAVAGRPAYAVAGALATVMAGAAVTAWRRIAHAAAGLEDR
jgi:phosphatidylglycerophosphate synthase